MLPKITSPDRVDNNCLHVLLCHTIVTKHVLRHTSITVAFTPNVITSKLQIHYMHLYSNDRDMDNSARITVPWKGSGTGCRLKGKSGSSHRQDDAFGVAVVDQLSPLQKGAELDLIDGRDHSCSAQ